MPENGDCFFACIVKQFQERWPAHLPPLTIELQRQWVAEYFRPENPKALEVLKTWEQLFRDEPEALEYRFMAQVDGRLETLQKVIKNRSLFWAEHVSIQLILNFLAGVFRRPIHLMLLRSHDWILVPLKSDGSSKAAAIQTYLLYKQEKHYQPLLWSGHRLFEASTIE
mgnify:CR=1 FL=1